MSNSAMTLTYTANKSIRTHEGEKKINLWICFSKYIALWIQDKT